MDNFLQRSFIVAITGLFSLAAAAQAPANYVYDQTFLDNYSNLQMRRAPASEYECYRAQVTKCCLIA